MALIPLPTKVHIRTVSGSFYLSIPQDVVRALGLKETDIFTVFTDEKGVGFVRQNE